MADSAAARGRLLRLASELAKERGVLERIGEEVDVDAGRLEQLPGESATRDPGLERAALAVVAVGLHRWYSALESIAERIERTFGTLPVGPEWHTELLTGAVLEIPGIRPAILPERCLDRLRDLQRFRQFFRHAYAVELDRRKLLVLAGDLRAVKAPVMRAIRDFEEFLRAAGGALDDA